MIPTTRREARETGAIYYTGRSCKRHGPTTRLTSNTNCVLCQRAAIKVYKQTNHDKVVEADRRRYNMPMTIQRFIKRCLKSARRRAKLKNLPINITYDYLIAVWTDCCPVFGTPFDLETRGRRQCDQRPSLDRIVPEWGYTIGNVVFISYLANTIKSSASLVQLNAVTMWLQRAYKDTSEIYGRIMMRLPGSDPAGLA